MCLYYAKTTKKKVLRFKCEKTIPSTFLILKQIPMCKIYSKYQLNLFYTLIGKVKNVTIS